MALLASVAGERGTDSVLAFAPYHDFLAAGTVEGDADKRGAVRILSGAGDSGLELGCDYRFEEVTRSRISSPAPVCRLSWSKAMWSFRMGLLAAGLANGQVAVWNPRVRDTLEDEGYFDKDFEVDIEDDYLSSEKPHQGAGALLHAHARSGNLAKDVAGELAVEQSEDEDWEVVADSDNNMVAMFAKHVGPVRGLSFGYRTNTFLASGGSHGRMLVWDLNDLSKDEIPTFEFTEGEDVGISAISWSRSDIIASACNTGTRGGPRICKARQSIWDINVKSPLIRKLPWTRHCSTVEWSPGNENQMVVAGNYYDIPSIQLWDMRKVARPVKNLLEDEKGILALSWCPFDENQLLACTDSNKIVLLNVKQGEVVYEKAALGACVDIRWSRKSGDHFAVSSCGKVGLYQRYPEI